MSELLVKTPLCCEPNCGAPATQGIYWAPGTPDDFTHSCGKHVGPLLSAYAPEGEVNVVPLDGERYFLAQDGDCHWYVVPVSKKKEWSAWRNLDEDDEESWDAPDWAEAVGGALSLVTFENPVVS